MTIQLWTVQAGVERVAACVPSLGANWPELVMLLQQN